MPSGRETFGVLAALMAVWLGLSVAGGVRAQSAPAGRAAQTGTASSAASASSPATASAPVVGAEVIQRLIRQLDDDNWRVREAASAELQKIGPQAETILEEALAKSLSMEAQERAQRVLGTIRLKKGGLNGVWTEEWSGVGYKDLVEITVSFDGKIAMRCAPDNPHTQYVYSNAKCQGDQFAFHVLANPGFEFDCVLKFAGPTEMTGRRTRLSDNQSWDFKMTKVRP